MKGRRGGSADQAREYRQQGHDDALIFALLLGMDKDYKNDPRAKKDVVDPSGDTHSLKSGRVKWQIFLYSRSRFESDDGFQALNGIGPLLIHCIDAFPPRYEDYLDNKDASKERLRTPMRELKDRFQRKALLRAFLMKSIFNGGEVNYLTYYHDEKYHVFRNMDIVRVLGESFEVTNSVAGRGRIPDQKVLFRYQEKNVGELEMRTDSRQHYAEVRFNMLKQPFVKLIKEAEPSLMQKTKKYSAEIFAYGEATKTFGNW